VSIDKGHGSDDVAISKRTVQGVQESFSEACLWRIEKRNVGEVEPYEVSEFEGNCLLNEGINQLLLLLVAGGGDAYDNTNTYLGVGDSNTAAAASQTALQAVTNKFWSAMEATYPTDPPVSQQVVFRSVFADGEAQYDWKEFTVVNAATDAGENLNRKVSDQGTKAAGQEWTLTLTITLS